MRNFVFNRPGDRPKQRLGKFLLRQCILLPIAVPVVDAIIEFVGMVAHHGY